MTNDQTAYRGLDVQYHTGILSARGVVMARKGTTQTDKLIKLADSLFDFYVDDVRQEVVAVPRTGPRVGVKLKGRDALSGQLVRAYYHKHGNVPNGEAMTRAISLFTARAEDPITTYLRCARLDTDALALDLGTGTGECVVIKSGRWQIEERGPVVFRRTNSTAAMTTPRRNGKLAPLRDLFNLDQQTWELVRVWLVLAWLENIPVPILALLGPNGAGKTFLAKLCVQLTDPKPALLRKIPDKAGDWPILLNNNRVVGLDNVSRMKQGVSDDIARGVTGDGDSRRALYTDDDEVIFNYRRAFILTSIDPGAMQGDFADRLMAVILKRIQKRLREEQMDSTLSRMMPGLFGGLLGTVARVLANPVEVEDLPRMADAACIMAALDQQVGGGVALSGYRRSHEQAAARVLESDPLTAMLLSWMQRRKANSAPRDTAGDPVNGRWAGTATDLYTELNKLRDPYEPQWPANPQKMSERLERASDALLRVEGLSLTRKHGDERLLVLEWL